MYRVKITRNDLTVDEYELWCDDVPSAMCLVPSMFNLNDAITVEVSEIN